MLIEIGFESLARESNVDFGVAILRCNFGFLDGVFRKALISDGVIGFLSTVVGVRVSWGFVQNSFVMALN